MTRIISLLTMMCSIFGCSAQDNGFTSLSVDDFEKAIADTTVIRLDVRTAAEYAEGCITGALNIDVTQPDFEEKAVALLPHDKTIAVNCRSGKRSKKAVVILVRNGYRVIELDKGYNAWLEAGKPIDAHPTNE